jgi:hypothetical protein
VSTGVAIIIVLGSLLVGALTYILIARRSPEGGRDHQTPTNVYAVTAGAMSLLIAFTMSMTFSQYTSAQQAAEQQAASVLAMSRSATFMGPNVRDALRDELMCYAEAIVDEQWESMRAGSAQVAPTVKTSLTEMDMALQRNAKEAGVGLSMWESANTARATASVQLLHIATSSVPLVLWLLLIFGSIITLGSLLVYADSSKPAWGHALVIVGPLFVAAAALVVISFFDRPFADTSGAVSPDSMRAAITEMRTERIGDLPLPECPRAGGSA